MGFDFFDAAKTVPAVVDDVITVFFHQIALAVVLGLIAWFGRSWPTISMWIRRKWILISAVLVVAILPVFYLWIDLYRRGGSYAAFNKIEVKSEFASAKDQKRHYSIWIEAEPDVLAKIDHVKYIFDDSTWNASKVFHDDISNTSTRDGIKRCFAAKVWAHDALDYITVLVMYKGYKPNEGESRNVGLIQPIPFRWRDHAKKVESLPDEVLR